MDQHLEMKTDAQVRAAAGLFRVLSAPMRLKIINALCSGEKNVGELLCLIPTTQPNMSQHLNSLYKVGVLGKRRDGVLIYYRIVNDRVVSLCRAICAEVPGPSDGKSHQGCS